MAKAEPEDSAATRILIVEDVPDDAELMKWELRRTLGPCTFVRAQSEGDVVRALHLFGPDVVLTDHSLPQFNALDSLRVVQRELPGTPVLVVTGSLDEETAADYIKAGAVDYIVKQRLHRLGPAVRRALALRQALEDAADAEAALARSCAGPTTVSRPSSRRRHSRSFRSTRTASCRGGTRPPSGCSGGPPRK